MSIVRFARHAFPGLAAALAISACSYTGDIDNPVTRKASWFSYVEGGDIRAACHAGSASRVRLVYNAIYEEQVRAYDLGEGGARLLVARAFDQANLAQGINSRDLLEPWRGQSAAVHLDEDQYARLMQSLEASGAFGRPAVGLELPSRSFYWTAASCRNGRYSFTAWAYPSPEFEALRFPGELFAVDHTGVPVNPPRKDLPQPLRHDPREPEGTFNLKVGERGLAGIL